MTTFTDQEYGVRAKGYTKDEDIMTLPSLKSVEWWQKNTASEIEFLVRDITFVMGRKWETSWKPYVAPEVATNG